jgi:UDP-glucose 4-epimerase
MAPLCRWLLGHRRSGAGCRPKSTEWYFSRVQAPRRRRVLVTGGAGFIGSVATLALLAAGHDVVVVDDLSNSSKVAVERVRTLAEEAAAGGALHFYQLDVRDDAALRDVIASHDIDSVMHFAGRKAVGESVSEPLDYYRVNLGTTMTLVGAMRDHGVRDLVFSSSATVYGAPTSSGLREDAPLLASNPYGRTKLFIEEILRDIAASEPGWNIALLRYFNPIGAHPSGRIGEDPRGIPNNLMPYIMQVAVGRRDELVVFGDDYATADGTCIRDYIHVVDLAEGHVAALHAIDRLDGCRAVNLGTGTGRSVLEVLAAAAQVVGRPLPFRIGARRPGDVPVTVADPALAAELLGWRATRTLDDMCVDAWRWQSANPNGYTD